MPYPIGLTEIQIAREAVAGTDLPTTSKLLCTSFNVSPVSPRYAPPVLRGLMQRNRGFETPLSHSVEFDIEGPLSYENGLVALLCGNVINVATPTGAGPYTWAFAKAPASYPSVATFTIERKEYDGATAIQHAWHYCVFNELTLTFAVDQPIMFSVHGFGRKTQTETLTPAITLPTPEIPPTVLATVHIDSTFAGLGATQVVNQVIGAELVIKNGAEPGWSLDGNADLTYTFIKFNPEEVQNNLSMTALLGAQYATEKAAALAQTLRAVQLKVLGTSGRSLTMGGLYKHVQTDLPHFGEQDGQVIVPMELEESSDGTNVLVVTLINNLATLS